MKVKMKYIYAGLFILVVLAIFLSINNNKNVETNATQISAVKISNESEMPNDDIHSKLNATQQTPNKANVSKNIVHEMDMLKKQITKTSSDTASIKKYAELLFASHKQAEAIKYYNQILKIDPKRKDILLDLVFAYYSLRDLGNAEIYTKQLSKYYPNDLSAQYNLGAIYASQGKKVAATNIWEKIISKYPESDEAKLSQSSLKQLNQ